MTRITEMTIEEKVALCSGNDFWNTKSFAQYDIASFMMADGPNGLRKQVDRGDNLGVNRAFEATAFPTSSLTACSFDEEIVREVGEAIGKEALAADVKVVLGPGTNIKRNPLCGRNFEYFSEDPYLSGKMAAAFIKGVEATGAHSCLKHFALNNQEYKRFSSNSIVDEKTMREIYLKPFEIAVKEGKPACVMSSYNKINNIHASEHKWLLTDILRNEWGFDGLVITDWGGMSNRIKSFEAGCDLCMPGGSNFGEREAIKAFKENKTDMGYLDKSVQRIIKVADKEVKKGHVDLQDNSKLAQKIAENSIVLLKNEDNILPIKNDDVAYIGYMAKKMRYQGAGSSHINPYKLTNPLDDVDVKYAYGYQENGETNLELLTEAKELAKKVKVVVLFVGLSEKYESEGYDRQNLKMPEWHLKLIEEVRKVNSNIVVVLMSGSVVELPFLNNIKGLIYAGLAGQTGGTAINNILFGKVNPSGKLAESWAKNYSDYVSSKYYGDKDALYKEGIYVGYRYFDKANVELNFPFGFGLSYSKFEYSNLEYKNHILSCTIKNNSNLTGKEVVQLYVRNPQGYRSIRELRGFKKIELKPQEAKKVSFLIDEEMFKVFNHRWIKVKGEYQLEIASSSRDIHLVQTVNIDGQDDEYPFLSDWYLNLNGQVSDEDFKSLYQDAFEMSSLVKGNFTMDNTVMEMKDYSIVMKIMYKAVEMVVAKGFNGKVNYEDPTFKMLMSSSADCSLNGMKICGAMNNNVLEGMLKMANGHFFKGILTMLKKN